MQFMNSLLDSLEKGVSIPRNEIEHLVDSLLQKLYNAIGDKQPKVVERVIDDTGAFPGVYCRLQSAATTNPFQCEWTASMSLSGYDNPDGSWKVNCCAYFSLFVLNKRISSPSGTLVLLVLKNVQGYWNWVNEGWVEDEYREFEDTVPRSST